nr:MarR family winged helix-turn-helix transcriptional regulator [uncultured Pseudodesulfovibrio sp.]
MSQSDDSLLFSRISSFRRLYAKALTARLETFKVRPGYIEILNRLWEQDHVTQKKLHARLDIEQATLSNTLKRMERDGLIELRRNLKDRRLCLICLTQTALTIKPKVQAAIEELQSVVNVGLTINDRRYFNRILKQMTQHLDEDLQAPCLVLLDEIADN